MPTINPTLIGDGDDITEDLLNAGVIALLTLVNGLLDAENLADGAVTLPKLASSVTLVPIGGIIDYWSDGGAIPTGWAICNGATISDVNSPLNGVATPNLVSKFTRGVANSNLRSVAVTGGADTHTLVTGELPAHNHGISDPGHTHASNNNIGFGAGATDLARGRTDANSPSSGWSYTNSTNTTGITTVNTGSNTAHNNIPAYVGMVKIMRIK